MVNINCINYIDAIKRMDRLDELDLSNKFIKKVVNSESLLHKKEKRFTKKV